MNSGNIDALFDAETSTVHGPATESKTSTHPESESYKNQ
jgi:hypothetical protein